MGGVQKRQNPYLCAAPGEHDAKGPGAADERAIPTPPQTQKRPPPPGNLPPCRDLHPPAPVPPTPGPVGRNIPDKEVRRIGPLHFDVPPGNGPAVWEHNHIAGPVPPHRDGAVVGPSDADVLRAPGSRRPHRMMHKCQGHPTHPPSPRRPRGPRLCWRQGLGRAPGGGDFGVWGL